MSATALKNVLNWLENVDLDVSSGYVTYIKLFVKKFEAARRFEEYSRGNLCVVCYENIGESNPRQLCCKRFCPYQN